MSEVNVNEARLGASTRYRCSFLKALSFLILWTASYATAETRVMALGDSLCRGNMAALRSLAAKESLAIDWVGTRKDGPAPDGDNECHAGWTAAEVIGTTPPPFWEPRDAALLPQWLSAHNPEVVLLMLGTNDVLRGDPQALEKNMTKIVEAIASSGSVRRIVIASIPPLAAKDKAEKAKEAALVIERVAKALEKRNVSFIDMHSKVPVHGVGDDQIHLNDVGNEVMGKGWLQGLKEALAHSR